MFTVSHALYTYIYIYVFILLCLLSMYLFMCTRIRICDVGQTCKPDLRTINGSADVASPRVSIVCQQNYKLILVNTLSARRYITFGGACIGTVGQRKDLDN